MLKLLFKLTGWSSAIGVVSFVGLLSSNLWLYQRVSTEQPVGTLYFQRLADQHYQATFIPDVGSPTQFELKGDQWQLDARILKWKSWAYLLGKDPLFQLERFSGRYSDPTEAMTHYPSVHSVSQESLFDVWLFAREYPNLMFMVDASYGTAVFLPMQDDVGYHISMSASGLVARQALPVVVF